jgi:hypothetical protein
LNTVLEERAVPYLLLEQDRESIRVGPLPQVRERPAETFLEVDSSRIDIVGKTQNDRLDLKSDVVGDDPELRFREKHTKLEAGIGMQVGFLVEPQKSRSTRHQTCLDSVTVKAVDQESLL